MKILKTSILLSALAATCAVQAYDFNDSEIESVTRTDTVTVVSALRSDGWRPTSLSVAPNQGATTLITGTWVKNTGSHRKTFYLNWDMSAVQVDAIQNQGWHIEDVEAYSKNGVRRYAILAYSAADQPNDSKWFDNLTSTQLQAEYNAWSGRISDLDVALVSGTNRYTGVMRKNTGANRKGWYWHTAIAFNDIQPFLSSRNARVVDICQRSDGFYSVAYWTDNATYRYVSARSLASLQNTISYYGYRVENINQTYINGQFLYTGVILNTKNDLTQMIGNRLRTSSDGNVGAYMKRVDGPVLANLQETTLFYPASTMKVYMHATAIWNTPQANLNTRQIPVWDDHLDNDHTGETPTMTDLPDVLNPMMVVSSNQMANACLDLFGMEFVESICRGNFGVSSKTQIRHKLGAGGPNAFNPFNETTLVDLGALYENVNKKFGATKRAFFRDNMLNKTSSTTFRGFASQERVALGVSNTNWATWQNLWEWQAKAGGITGYTSIAGWIRLPFRGPTGIISFRDYTFGLFKDDYQNNSVSVWTDAGELLRDEMNKSLATFVD